MAVDPFLLDYDRGELAVASEFLTNWLPFLTRGLCDGCSAALRRRVESIAPGELAEIPEDPREAGPRGFEEIQATGWDPDPDPEPDRLVTESDRTPAPLFRELVSVPITTGWGAPEEVIYAVVPDAPPEVPLELVPLPVQNGWDVEPERPQIPVPLIPKPTVWDVDYPPTPGEGNVDLQPVVEGSVKSGWDSVPEEETVDVADMSAAEEGSAKEKVKLSWAEMAEDEESDRTPAPLFRELVSVPVTTGWDAPAEVIYAVVPSGWDAPPEVALELVPVQNGWDVEPEMPQTPVPLIPKPPGWDVDSPPTSEEGNVDLQPAVERSMKSGWDSVPEEETADVADIPAAEEGSAKEKVKLSWADMAEDEELGGEEVTGRSPISESGSGERKKVELSREQRELIRFRKVRRKKDFICLERVKGRVVNVLAGLELHTGVFSAVEQKRIVDFVFELQDKGRKNELGEHTYSKPRKWMRGKGRETIQFGCCYNYAAKNGNPPGILKNVLSDPLPPLFKMMIKRMVRWHILSPSVVPDSCIVNIYEAEDCIPPHIDSHDFVRPFCTVSFLSECNILFGSELKIVGPGEFEGSFAIPLPVGSVLVLNGNGADVAKHCVPAVPTKRISITFRTMDKRKRPLDFVPEPDLQNLLPLPYDPDEDAPMNNTGKLGSESERHLTESRHSMVKMEHDFRQSRHPSYIPETPIHRSSRLDVDTVPPSSISSIDRGRGSAGRLSEPRTYERGLLGTGPGQVNTDMFVGRSARQGIQNVRTARFDGSSEQRGGRGQLEQKRSMHSSNRNWQGEDEESIEGYSGGRVMFEQQWGQDEPLLEQQQEENVFDLRSVLRRGEQQRSVTRRDEPMLDEQRFGVRPRDIGHRRGWADLSYR